MLRRDPRRAKVEILKHLDGDLVIVPRPSSPGERRAEISGRAKADSLLRDQEAVFLQVVAGAGYAECYTAPESYWVDLKSRALIFPVTGSGASPRPGGCPDRRAEA